MAIRAGGAGALTLKLAAEDSLTFIMTATPYSRARVGARIADSMLFNDLWLQQETTRAKMGELDGEIMDINI